MFINNPGHVTKMAAMPHIWQKPHYLKIGNQNADLSDLVNRGSMGESFQ